MLIDIIAGARPNFMKIAPIIRAIKEAQKTGKNISYRLIHTGQHYDKNMSDSFFEQLEIPLPDINLEVGSGTQAQQAGNIMIRYEDVILKNAPDLTLVVGDVTSTMACSIAAKKLGIKVAHVEGGIRSFDLSMPEEINRMVTDSISDYFFTTSKTANHNLEVLGVRNDQIFFVGNTMIDTLISNIAKFKKPDLFDENKLKQNEYLVLTLHRPSNVDNEVQLEKILNTILLNTQGLPVIFPIHPRTKKNFQSIKLESDNLILIDPQGYLEFNYLVANSKAVITDSGGITEETTYLKKPCITLRDNTERPETVSEGTNELIGSNPEKIATTLEKLFSGDWKKGAVPEKWDGKTSERIVEHICEIWKL